MTVYLQFPVGSDFIFAMSQPSTTTQKAYRLGTIPRLVLRECRQVNIAKATHENVLALVGEWHALLSELKASTLHADVKALKACVEAEKNICDAQAQYERQQKRYQALIAMGEDVPPPVKPAVASLPTPGSLELASALVEEAESKEVLNQLSEDVRDLYELGTLVARCRFERSDDVAAMRIWTIAKGLGCEEWVTGRPANTSGEPGESIDGLISSRLPEIDRLFSTQPLPDVEAKAVGTPTTQAVESPYLTIEEAAKILKVGADTVERMIGSGKLVASEIRGRGKSRTIKRIHRSELDRYMETNRASISAVEPTARRSRKKPPTKDYIG